MKKILAIFILGIGCFVFASCTQKSNKKEDALNALINDNVVSLVVKDGSLTNKNVTLILENNSNYNYEYGSSYSIEYQEGNAWCEKEPNNEMNFTMIAYGLGANESKEIMIDWEGNYGTLSSGIYRIVIAISPELDQVEGATDKSESKPSEEIYLSAEFIIEE